MNNLIEYKGYYGSVEYSNKDDYLSLCEKEGLTPEKIYKGSFNIRISPEMHKKLAMYSFSQRCSINSTVEEAVAEYLADKE